MQHFFITLFNCSRSPQHINSDSFNKVLKYCEIVQFFTDLGQAILVGPKGIEKKKFDLQYKPLGIDYLINGAINLGDLDFIFGEKLSIAKNEIQGGLLENELDGTNLDIDNLYPVLNSNESFDIQIPLEQENTTKKPLSDYMINRYASLREKYRTVNGTSLTDIQETTESEKTIGSRNKLANGKTKAIINSKKSEVLTLNIPGQNPKNYVLATPSGSHNPLSTKNQIQSQNIRVIKPGSYGERLNTEEAKKTEAVRVSYEPSRTDGFRSLKAGKGVASRDGLGDTSLQQIKEGSRNYIAGSRSNLDSRKGRDLKPERITMATEFYNDAMTYEDAQVLNVLYPISNASRNESDIDKESKKVEFSVSGIRLNDVFSVPACSLLEELFCKVLNSNIAENHESNYENDEHKGKKMRYEMNRKLGNTNIDYTPFWEAVFGKSSSFFEKIFKVKF